MTYEFEYLMHLFSCGARGTTPIAPRQAVDFDCLLQLAYEQSVLPIVSLALGGSIHIGFPSDKVRAITEKTRNLAFINYAKRRQVLNLLQSFEKAGIQAVLLKGYVLADLYSKPDCRISADTDIYVNIEDEKRAYKLLSEHGCKVNPRSPTSHHAVCEHPHMGCIELHTILYGKIVEDVWFKKMDGQQYIHEPYEKYESEEGSCYTLGRTDNLIFLVLHLIKHFIASGISLRQMMDIALYMKTYQKAIDFGRFWDILESLKYRKLVNTVLNAMVKYCNFSPNDFTGYTEVDEGTVLALLDDLETGGWLGSKEMNERESSWIRYNKTRYSEERSSFAYWCYMLKRNIDCCLHIVLPPKGTLKTKYPYARKIPWLAPFAWIQNIFSGAWRLLSGKLNTGIVLREDKISKKDKDRIHLFKLMNIM